jgi:hypothetical protein
LAQHQLSEVFASRQPGKPQAPAEDDLFGSALGNEQLAKTVGSIGQRGLLRHKLMVLMPGADQSVPDWVDKEDLFARWKNATDHNGADRIRDQERSRLTPGASHALSNDVQAEPRASLCSKVLEYLANLETSE